MTPSLACELLELIREHASLLAGAGDLQDLLECFQRLLLSAVWSTLRLTLRKAVKKKGADTHDSCTFLDGRGEIAAHADGEAGCFG